MVLVQNPDQDPAFARMVPHLDVEDPHLKLNQITKGLATLVHGTTGPAGPKEHKHVEQKR